MSPVPNAEYAWDRGETHGGGPCARCGADPANGFASIYSDRRGTEWLCHPDNPDLPDCYSLWTPQVAP